MKQDDSLAQLVESFRFADVVVQWARERLEHEEIVARALVRGVVADGLKLQSADARWLGGDGSSLELRRRPLVGYCASPGAPMCLLRSSALDHMFAVMYRAETPALAALSEEFVMRADFRDGCERAAIPLPRFWFGRSLSRVDIMP